MNSASSIIDTGKSFGNYLLQSGWALLAYIGKDLVMPTITNLIPNAIPNSVVAAADKVLDMTIWAFASPSKPQ